MTQGDHIGDRGMAPRRRRVLAPRAAPAFHERMTPLCECCKLPLVESDDSVCPRCAAPPDSRMWSLLSGAAPRERPAPGTRDWSSHAAARRQRLIDWMWERPEHVALTARQIVDVSGLYDAGNGRYDTCLRDLVGLLREGYVDRDGYPARWTVVTA